MAYTTVPSIIITLIIFLIWGFTIDSQSNLAGIAEVQQAISSQFNITGWLFIVPALVILLIVRKVPALPALLVGTLMGAVFALIFQPQIIDQVSGVEGDAFVSAYKGIMKAMYTDVNIVTGNSLVDELLSSGGMFGMLNTVWLIMCAMIFGGVMESTGMLKCIASQIIRLATSTGSLIASTAGTCIVFNLTASDQYLAIVVPGRMFASTFKERGLAPENLSRTLEDAGTVTSVLIPWNTCGAYQSSVLGVSPFTYFTYCFFNIISPLMTVLFAYLNIKIRRIGQPAMEIEKLREEVAL